MDARSGRAGVLAVVVAVVVCGVGLGWGRVRGVLCCSALGDGNGNGNWNAGLKSVVGCLVGNYIQPEAQQTRATDASGCG